MSIGSSSPRPTGFTLLEVLAALAVMSVLALSLYASFRIGFAARRRAVAAVEPGAAAAEALRMIGQDLASVPPPTGLLAGAFVSEVEQGVSVGDASGGSAVLRMRTASGLVDIDYDQTDVGVRRMGGDEPGGGRTAGADVEEVEYRLESDERAPFERRLVRLVTSNLLAPTTPEPGEQVVCRNVRAFEVRYYDGSQWLEAWDSTQQDDRLPRAVWVGLELVEPSALAEMGRGEAVGPTSDGSGRSRRFTRVFRLPAAGPDESAGGGVLRR